MKGKGPIKSEEISAFLVPLRSHSSHSTKFHEIVELDDFVRTMNVGSRPRPSTVAGGMLTQSRRKTASFRTFSPYYHRFSQATMKTNEFYNETSHVTFNPDTIMGGEGRREEQFGDSFVGECEEKEEEKEDINSISISSSSTTVIGGCTYEWPFLPPSVPPLSYHLVDKPYRFPYHLLFEDVSLEQPKRRVDLSHWNLRDGDLRKVCKANKHISELVLEGNVLVSDLGMSYLSPLLHLSSLSLKDCTCVREDGLEHVFKTAGSHLRFLDISGTRLGDEYLMVILANCHTLHTVLARKSHAITPRVVSAMRESMRRYETNQPILSHDHHYFFCCLKQVQDSAYYRYILQ